MVKMDVERHIKNNDWALHFGSHFPNSAGYKVCISFSQITRRKRTEDFCLPTEISVSVPITITLQDAEIYDFGIELVDDGQTVYFSVEGAVQNVDEELLKEALEAQDLRPERIVFETGEAPDNGDSNGH